MRLQSFIISKRKSVFCMHALAVVLLMSILTDLPSAEEVQERVNQRYDSLYYTDSDRGRLACVCVVCDKFIEGEGVFSRDPRVPKML